MRGSHQEWAGAARVADGAVGGGFLPLKRWAIGGDPSGTFTLSDYLIDLFFESGLF